jgi:hypothetical protein
MLNLTPRPLILKGKGAPSLTGEGATRSPGSLPSQGRGRLNPTCRRCGGDTRLRARFCTILCFECDRCRSRWTQVWPQWAITGRAS